MAVNCGPYYRMAQGISTHGPHETSFNCSVVDGVCTRRVIRVQRITGIEYNELRG